MAAQRGDDEFAFDVRDVEDANLPSCADEEREHRQGHEHEAKDRTDYEENADFAMGAALRRRVPVGADAARGHAGLGGEVAVVARAADRRASAGGVEARLARRATLAAVRPWQLETPRAAELAMSARRLLPLEAQGKGVGGPRLAPGPTEGPTHHLCELFRRDVERREAQHGRVALHLLHIQRPERIACPVAGAWRWEADVPRDALESGGCKHLVDERKCCG
mmetsp:Transcript_81878/g.250213  ORF Transcript_81878/g.250213 Transcript_81878/m.250213 type:complete len:222 (-) Transcript_81878:1205-1870(-)